MRTPASLVASAAASLLALAAVGCTTDPGIAGPPHDDAGITPMGDAGPTPVDANLPPGEPTYYGMVDDILAEHCWGCHSDVGGGIAPYNLDTYESASMHAPLIAAYTQSRRMPPFFAVNDGTCQTFEDHGRWLSDTDIAILGQWNANGAPMGTMTTPPTVMTPPTIDAPDVTITMPQPFTPQMRGTDPNEFRCFVVDPGVTTDQFITAYEVRPGNALVVHHVIVFEPESDADATTAAGMENADGRPGYPCSGGTIVPSHPVALWAPGGHRTDYPATTGLALPAGRRLIIQIHYNLTNDPAQDMSDTTSIRFETTATVARPASMLLLSQSTLALPPHLASTTSAPRSFRSPGAGTLWGVFPHMHTAGRQLGLTLTHGSTTSCIADVERWDFNWQQAYFYTTPISVASGDRVTITCEFNTMTRDATTTYGEGTEDEMCLSFFYVTAP